MTMTASATERSFHIAINGQAAGPYTYAEVEAKIISGESSGASLSWMAGEASWSALSSREEFQTILEEHARWFVVRNAAQFGPILKRELQIMIEERQVIESTLCWREGMSEWKPLSKIESLAALMPKAPAVPALPALPALPKAPAPPAMPAAAAFVPPVAHEEHRSASRAKVRARLIVSNDKTVNVASCRDISEGGMQVLCDELPGPVGTRIKMNVTPEGSNESFVAKGLIIRIREDQRGYSFRFDELTEGAKRAIAHAVARDGARAS
jgi:hypothetical protein